MECDDARILIAGHLDRELDPVHDLEVAQHIEGCAACAREFATAQAAASRVGAGDALRFAAPPALRARVAAALSRERGGDARASRWLGRGVRVAIPLAAATLLLVALAPRLWRGVSSDDMLERELVADHVRSLMASHLADVASSDRHTVKPWFAGKLDFSPPVDDLAAAGFPLVGGRLDYLGGRAVAALVYRHGGHMINVFVWPAAGGSGGIERFADRDGYHVIRFATEGMNYAVVSDLSRDELEKFVAMLGAPARSG